MTSPFRAIGEAVAAKINADYAGTKADEVSAALDWRAERKLSELAALDVTLLRRQNTGVRADRNSWRDQYTFDLVIRKRFEPRGADAVELDPYEDLATELRDFLRPLSYTLADDSIAHTEAADIVTPYDPQAFDKEHVFLTVIRIQTVVCP